MTIKHASRIISAITPDRLLDIGMTERTIRHAKSSGRFAAMWYLPIKELCESHGVFCPLEAFTWKAPAKKHGGDLYECQGGNADGNEKKCMSDAELATDAQE